MRMQGYYTAAGPRTPCLPRWLMALLGLVVLALVAAIALIIVDRRGAQTTEVPPPAAAVAQVQPQNRIFADEMGYVPTAQEYANLGDDYVPLAPLAPLGAAAPAVQLPVATGGISPRILAQELSYVPTAQEYAMLGESYLPAAPVVVQPVEPGAVNPRILAEELSAGTTYDPAEAVFVPEMQQFEVTPRIGPR